MKEQNAHVDFERNILLELMREHAAIQRIHKVRLRPIAITLFDSQTRWGQFDDLSRSISLSRRLINESPWQIVLGVFRHEVAHQLVAEENPTRSQAETQCGKPHGELFKAACKRLGVPEQFARASLDLQSCNLDWRIEPQDEATTKILDKVRKLLALANSTNEHEALLAMERVRGLYAKYNLEHHANATAETFVHLVITQGKRRQQSWEKRILSVLIEHFFVTALTFSQFDATTGTRVRAFELIGTRENVLMAEFVYHFLLHQLDRLVNEEVNRGVISARSERSSFKLGVLEGFSRKLKAAETSKPVQTAQASAHASAGASHETPQERPNVVSSALSLFRQDAKLDRYLSTIYPNVSTARRPKLRVDSQAFTAGRSAGTTITLNKPISSQMGNRGHSLHSGKSENPLT
jgi:hypothetical protein